MSTKTKPITAKVNSEQVKVWEKFFFSAILKVLAPDAEWIETLKGTSFSYSEGDLCLEVQCNLPNESEVSGKISIVFQKIYCVWELHYNSEPDLYDRRDLPFLVCAYSQAYEKEQFFDGRDRSLYQEPGSDRACENRPFPGEFEEFGGIETVWRVPKDCAASAPITTLIYYHGGTTETEIQTVPKTVDPAKVPAIDSLFDLSLYMTRMFLFPPTR